MSLYAYLNTTGEVVSISIVERLLAEAQAKVPEVTQVISNAPDGLVPKLSITTAQLSYHTKTSGDGSDISHYTFGEDLDTLKRSRMEEIEARTAELKLDGFVYSDTTFGISTHDMLNLIGMDTNKDAAWVSYPVTWDSMDGMDSISVADSTAWTTFFSAAFEAYLGHETTNTALKTQIRNAATIAEVTAIVDNR